MTPWDDENNDKYNSDGYKNNKFSEKRKQNLTGSSSSR